MRFTISLENKLGERFDQFIQERGYKNRSEAVRDLIREKLEQDSLITEDNSDCIGTLTYIYNHEERDLTRRLAGAQHQYHDLCISTSYVLLDHDNRMETVALRGKVKDVTTFSEHIISQPGVRHGQIYIVPVMIDHTAHTHNEGSSSSHPHTHVTPHS